MRASSLTTLLMVGQAACGKVAGFEEFTYSDGGSSESASGAAGAYPIGAGESASCDGGADEASVVDAAAATACGFIMPNPASAGLPNPAHYMSNASDGTVFDEVTGLTWEGTVDPGSYTQSQAVAYCARKGGSWRLPTRIELTSLVDFTIAPRGPTINAIFARTPAEKFWTSTHAVCDPGIVWYVGFDTGRTRQVSAAPPEIERVRCVSGAPSRCPPTRYQIQADGVHDETTGLTWRQDIAPRRPWTEAVTYCPTALGTGWRLPSLTELQTIMDDTRQDPSIDDKYAFPHTPIDLFWTSSALAGNSDYAWYATTKHGHADTDRITNEYLVRCVRWDGALTP